MQKPSTGFLQTSLHDPIRFKAAPAAECELCDLVGQPGPFQGCAHSKMQIMRFRGKL